MKLDQAKVRMAQQGATEVTKRFFEKDAKDDEVYEIRELMDLLGIKKYDAMRNATLKLAREGVCSVIHTHIYNVYGTHKAIENLKKEMGWEIDEKEHQK